MSDHHTSTTATSGTATPAVSVHLGDDELRRSLVDAVTRGLTRLPRRLPAWLLYDERGSQLFDRITRLPEYYPTEAEREILAREAASIVELSGADTVVELGSGTSDKTRTLLDAFDAAGRLARFVPFDVSEETLRAAVDELSERYPRTAVHGIVGDFTLHLAQLPTGGCRMVAFLGSTIGNLHVEERRAFLGAIADSLAPGDSLLLGVDLVKDLDRLVAAYDDAEGVTAEFSRNVLHVINRELGGDFEPERFDHVAFWDPREERMDLRLRADGDQRVVVSDLDLEIYLRDGEEIRVEISTKFRASSISAELEDAGFVVRQLWTDAAGDFGLVLAEVS